LFPIDFPSSLVLRNARTLGSSISLVTCSIIHQVRVYFRYGSTMSPSPVGLFEVGGQTAHFALSTPRPMSSHLRTLAFSRSEAFSPRLYDMDSLLGVQLLSQPASLPCAIVSLPQLVQVDWDFSVRRAQGTHRKPLEVQHPRTTLKELNEAIGGKSICSLSCWISTNHRLRRTVGPIALR
jgi:hypothetical protein